MLISTMGRNHSITFPQSGMQGKLTEGHRRFISFTAVITGPLRRDCIILPDADLRNKLPVLIVWLAIPGYTREGIALGSSDLTAPYWLQPPWGAELDAVTRRRFKEPCREINSIFCSDELRWPRSFLHWSATRVKWGEVRSLWSDSVWADGHPHRAFCLAVRHVDVCVFVLVDFCSPSLLLFDTVKTVILWNIAI